MAQRIKGQEVRWVLTGPVGRELQSGDAVSVEFTIQTEILSEGYIGETTNRRDDIFRGVAGNAEFHCENGEPFNLMQRIIDRSRRRDPASGVFNFTFGYSFPEGSRRRVVVQDVFFGEMPFRAPARDEYVTFTLPFEASQVQFI
jgi:hypothetical protein